MKPIHTPKVLPLSLAVAMLMVSACSTYDKAIENQKAIYKRAEKREIGLDVPPDLTAQSADEQFLIPGERASGSVSATDFYTGKRPAAGAGRNASAEPILVKTEEVEIRNNGRQRTLYVKRPAEQVWPVLRDFWKENGFNLTTDDAKTGLMETDWAENRAAIPVDGVRKVIGRVFDGMYSSNQRDRYRTRLEPLPDGGVEVFLTHRGMEENYTDKSQTTLQWMNRPADPELEAEMLNRLLVKLTGNDKAGAQLKKTSLSQQLVTVNKTANGSTITLAEDFASAWRRVGFGLDRAGFVVEDRDRANGVYYVKYVPDTAQPNKDEKKSFFGDFFSKKSDTLSTDQRFQVQVNAQGKDKTEIRFASDTGKTINPKISTEASDRLIAKLRQ